MVVPAGAEVTLYFTINGNLAINRLGALITGTPVFNQALADVLGSGIKSTWTTNLGGLCATTTALVRIGVRDLRNDNLPEFRDTGASVAGVGVGEPLPGSVAFVLTLRTAVTGKSGRGRIYLGGFTEAQNGPNGTALGAVQTGAINFVNGVDTNLQGSGLKLAVVTRPQPDVRIVKTTTFGDGTTEVKTLSHQTAKPGRAVGTNFHESRNLSWESQRRRINGRGLPPALLFGSVGAAAPGS